MSSLRVLAVVCLGVGCGGGDPLDGPPLPAVTAISIPNGAVDVPATAWFALEVSGDLPADVSGSVTLSCSDSTPDYDVDVFATNKLVVNPRSPLPSDTRCAVRWIGADGATEETSFTVASEGEPAVVPQDHTNTEIMDAFPDDFWLVEDSAHPSGKSLSIPIPDETFDTRTVVGAFVHLTTGVDGFSPVTPIIVDLPTELDPASVPMTSGASMDPTASLGLFDIDPTSPEYGKRIPFFIKLENQINTGDNVPDNLLVAFPGVRLRPRGRYAFVVSRRALVSPGRPLEPSEFHLQALGCSSTESDQADQNRAGLEPVLATLAEDVSPPIRPDDIALVLPFTIRSMDDVGRDLLSIRAQVDAMPAPAFTIDSVTAPDPPHPTIAAIVVGTFTAPVWNEDDYFIRDQNGLPTTNGTRSIPFRLAVPKGSETTPVPVTMYQHGTPGSDMEVQFAAGRLGGEHAVIGFTDLLNRDFDGTLFSERMFLDVLANREFPDVVHNLAIADQLVFIKLIKSLGALDVLPIGAPDGNPELDVTQPLSYMGISQGSNHGVMLLPYAPEIHAASLIVGGGRYSGIILHQAATVYEAAVDLFPYVSWKDGYQALAMAQIGIDYQDPINHAAFLYQNPHSLTAGDARASVLMVEGLADTLTPPWATHATANELGIPILQPVQLAVPFIETVSGPVQANIDTNTTAALFQYVPFGVPGVAPTPSCATIMEEEGHFCPQIATESQLQMLAFFRSALGTGAPIIDVPPAASVAAPAPTPFVPVVTRAVAPRP